MDDIHEDAVVFLNNVRGMVQELMDSDDENTEVLEKMDGFFESTVPNFNDKQFKQHFRLSRETLEYLAIELSSLNELNEDPHVGRPKMPLEKQILMCLWYLGNCESIRSVACRFGVGKHCCWIAINDIVSKMIRLNLSRRIIAFPRIHEAPDVVRQFEGINGFPGIIGAIDGCHIEIEKPMMNGNSYINRKGYASILLQGVCDSNKVFLDVYAGEPGSIHDQRLFTKSPLFRQLRDGTIQLPVDCHFIGDLAYKLTPTVIVGFKDNGHLNAEQIQFNQLLNSNRVKIEHAFGLLKARFRRLKRLETKRMDLIPQYIVTACILHNICLERGDLFAVENEVEVEMVPDDPGGDDDDNDDQNDGERARLKRLNIMNVVLMRNNFYGD